MEIDVRSYSNWKNLVMVKHFLRPKVLGVPLIGGATFEDVDVYMHHPAKLFGSEPGWKHKFFFTNRLRIQPRADRAGAKVRGGYWLNYGRCEIIKETDGTRIGSKAKLVFHEGMFIIHSKRTKWYMNEYLIFEEQPLKSNDLNVDCKKKETWILCELFQNNDAEDKDSKEFPAVNPTLAGDQPSEAMSVPVVEAERFERHPGSRSVPGLSAREEINGERSVSDGGQGDARFSAWSGHEWMNKRTEDYTGKDYDDFMAAISLFLDSP